MAKARKKSVEMLKCPWCSRMAPVTNKNAMAPHMGHGGRTCVGVGMTSVRPLAAALAARHGG